MTTRRDREVRWLKGARRDFEAFPAKAREKAFGALRQVVAGQKPEIAKPLHGLGSGVWELVLKERGDAYRLVYVLQTGDEIWVIHAFQKKSKSGSATPNFEIDLVRKRLKMLKS